MIVYRTGLLELYASYMTQFSYKIMTDCQGSIITN